jgi:membrane-bound lytic murein transglycosylase B
VSGRRRATRATALASATAVLASLLLATGPAGGAPAQETPTTTTTTPQDLATTRPADTPGVDPVLDGVPVEDTPAIRAAEADLNAAAAAQSDATLRWIDAQNKRAELAQRAGQAGQLAAQADAVFQVAVLDQAVQQRQLAERKQTEADLRATLADRQEELRGLAAKLYATAPEDRYAVLGSIDDITEADRRSALRDRGSDLQVDRVTAARRPWAKARDARIASQRQVKKAAATTAERQADATKAAAERDNADALLRDADGVVATAAAAFDKAQAATQAVLTGRRTARLEADVAGLGLPLVALHAYWRASELAPCQIPWWVIAGIGRVESGHGSAHGSSLTAEGDTTVHILGIPLDGRPGVAAIADTDGGRLDDDAQWDRAVGPMQFIPGTWNRWAADGNADLKSDPHNIYDAAGAAARYLCYSRGDLLTEPAIRGALMAYNRSVPYGTKVLAEGGRYRDALDLPDVPVSRAANTTDTGN